MEVKEIAFGPLGLKPDEFWRLTPAEIEDMIRGYKRATEDWAWLLAWHAAWCVNVHLKPKDRLTPDKMLGRSPRKGKNTKIPREQQQKILSELEDELGAL